MYQPETMQYALSVENPNYRKMLKLRTRAMLHGEVAVPMEPETDSGRTLNKQARRLAELKNTAVTKKAMDAAKRRGEDWEPNCKLRRKGKLSG